MKSVLSRLKYPQHLINSTINTFVNSRVADQQSQQALTEMAENVTQVVMPFKDQDSANIVKAQLKDLSVKLQTTIQPVFISRKIAQEFQACETKPQLVNQQCAVSQFQCDLCDTGSYVGYTREHLHVRVDEHKSTSSSVRKHYDKEHAGAVPDDLLGRFKVLKKWGNKFDWGNEFELFRETLSEKNPRKLHKPIPKGILGSFIISVKSLKNMAGDAMDVCLRVLKEAHKNRYDTYSVRKVPCFATVMQLKQYFLQNCKEEIFPATDTTFQIGYYADGNKKFSISSEIQLAEVFSLVKNGMITLWVDPHKNVPRGSSGKKRKGKKHNKPCFARFVAPKVK